MVYLKEPEIEIDNNLVENAIRPTALGKKNWLFFGDADAGERRWWTRTKPHYSWPQLSGTGANGLIDRPDMLGDQVQISVAVWSGMGTSAHSTSS
jgi:Transposase IS66 family